MSKHKHPLQKMEIDERGVLRFVPNAIISWLIDSEKTNMNEIAIHASESENITDEDLSQFAQLTGYSVDGFLSLSYSECDRERVEKEEPKYQYSDRFGRIERGEQFKFDIWTLMKTKPIEIEGVKYNCVHLKDMGEHKKGDFGYLTDSREVQLFKKN